MPTFFECFFENNPTAKDDLASLVAPLVVGLIDDNLVVEEPSGIVDGINTTFTLSNIPNPPESLRLNILSGSSFIAQESPADYTTAIIADVFTIEMSVAPVGGTTLQALYYAL